jgi:RNA polymerase-binding transcription factor DksA
LQAKLVELIEIVGIRQPGRVESVARPLQQTSIVGRLEVRSMDLSRHNFNLLQQILIALDRIEAGTYGTCKGCQGKIEFRLLSATPWAALCSACEPSTKSSAAR